MSRLRLAVLFPLLRWVSDKESDEILAQLAADAGLEATALGDPESWDLQAWAPADAVGRFVELCRGRAGDEEAFRRMCAYELRQAYQHLDHLLWALTPAQVYQRAAATIGELSTDGRYEIVAREPGLQHWRYYCEGESSRGLCLLRQANAELLPTLWELQPATVEERACIAHGDPCCEYVIRWKSREERQVAS